ncbi:MAG: glycoside hydrolase N-terminal domain-containing protein [Clostridia bacterium]|nr:glycoside hydrolase N-terminal domain-containing protein [Clostridia bacterium]
MKRFMVLLLTAAMAMPGAVSAQEKDVKHLYQKGNFSHSYSEVGHNPESRAWREGMVGGNGETGFVTSGSPYSDTIIYQHMYFNFPSADPRSIPQELTGQLEDARLNVFNLNDSWVITNSDGSRRNRTFYYSYHPGAQLRIESSYTDEYSGYERWTNYETAEVGVRYSDKYGEWTRTTFTSREDNVTITRIKKSSEGQLVDTVISIDNIADMCKSWNGTSKVRDLRYKKLIGTNADYIALAAHYPAYSGSELYDGGYAGVTKIIAEGKNAGKQVVSMGSGDEMLLGENNAISVTNAESVYLITATDRSFSMTGSVNDVMSAFASMDAYALVGELSNRTSAVAAKYTADGKFNYAAALAPSAKEHGEEFNRLTFDLDGDEEYQSYDNDALIALQRGTTDRINHEFMERSYSQARYAQICAGGTTAPRLYGMWSGEWNPGWRSIYTLDANVNLQVSAMNTGNLREFQLGYITFFLRHAPDFMLNAEKAYGMHDAIQLSVNADADRAMHVEYDSSYPFEYWNAGASWCLLPIYEYWQCFGNVQIPINDYMRIDNLQGVLSVNDGGLTNEEFAALKAKGFLDLEKDILLPLLTKQANFWEQIVTPRYYTDSDGRACHDESKTVINAGEKYIIIPSYSPENHPVGYTSTLTANATMDISAAKDGLDMVCAIEAAVGRVGHEAAVSKWQELKDRISDYKSDSDGALREWAMEEYTENNNHRHLSHLYVAWPAYDIRNSTEIAKAANIALNNRNRYNTGDATAGHGWMHKALVEARLRRGDGMMASLLKMMNATAYYSSLMTDHDTNRRNDTYCTDTAFGAVGAVNEALVFSNTGEIEIIPALPSDWNGGKVTGIMSRSRAEITSLEWNLENRVADVTIASNKDGNTIKLRCGELWTAAKVNGIETAALSDSIGKYVSLSLNAGDTVKVSFTLDEVLNDIIVKCGDAEVESSLILDKYERVVLTAETLKNAYEAADWHSEAMAVARVNNGVIVAQNKGSTVITVSIGSLSKKIAVNVLGSGDSIYKAEVASVSGSDGYSEIWAAANAFDGDASTAYASKDNAEVKYLEAELCNLTALTKLAVVGRRPEADENYAIRINGAKVYAANSPMNGNPEAGTLVGEVGGVTATSEYIPAMVRIDTDGKQYRYYMIYFDSVNNGSSISMAAAEIEFYSDFLMGRMEKAEIHSDNAPLAIDQNTDSAQSASEGEFVFELDEARAVTKVIIKKQKNAGGTSYNNYWADWVLAVGCEVQGSLDATTWETIGRMNPSPDGKDNSPEEIFALEEAVVCKYIRYVRTEIKTSSSYGAWLFRDDNGNRLNLAEIEIYFYNPYNLDVSESGDVLTIRGIDGEYDAYFATYDASGVVEKVRKIDIMVENGEAELQKEDATKLFIWREMESAARPTEI